MKEIILAFIGTFFGAFFAFQLQLSERIRTTKKAELAAGRRALLVLCNQYQHIKRYYVQALSEHEKDEFRWLKLLPYDSFHTFLRLEINSLTFLLDSAEPKLLQDILLTEENFLELITTVHQRNDIHLNQFQIHIKRIQEASNPTNEDEIKKILGENLVVKLKLFTDYTYEMANSFLKLNEDAFKHLNTHLNAHYPDYVSLKREDHIRVGSD